MLSPNVPTPPDAPMYVQGSVMLHSVLMWNVTGIATPRPLSRSAAISALGRDVPVEKLPEISRSKLHVGCGFDTLICTPRTLVCLSHLPDGISNSIGSLLHVRPYCAASGLASNVTVDEHT